MSIYIYIAIYALYILILHIYIAIYALYILILHIYIYIVYTTTSFRGSHSPSMTLKIKATL